MCNVCLRRQFLLDTLHKLLQVRRMISSSIPCLPKFPFPAFLANLLTVRAQVPPQRLWRNAHHGGDFGARRLPPVIGSPGMRNMVLLPVKRTSFRYLGLSRPRQSPVKGVFQLTLGHC